MPAIPSDRVRVAILSDIHYAGTAERARGNDYEMRSIANPLLRAFVRFYRHHIWMREPLTQGEQLEVFKSRQVFINIRFFDYSTYLAENFIPMGV